MREVWRAPRSILSWLWEFVVSCPASGGTIPPWGDGISWRLNRSFSLICPSKVGRLRFFHSL